MGRLALDGSVDITSFSRHVSLAPGEPATYLVEGELCVPTGTAPRTLHLLVSGATYGRDYWDFPIEPARYSYVRAMAERGIATLNFDRLGIGASSHPPGDLVTVPAGAHVVHELISAVRAGELGPVFEHVVAVGHSLGSVIVISEAAEYDDVDGVVISGLLHHLDEGLGELNANLHPVEREPDRFPDLGAGYLTSVPGTRGRVFYHLPNAAEQVIEADENGKHTFTEAEQVSFPVELARSVEIDVPVLVVVGDQDTFFCTWEPCSAPSGGAAGEAAHWPKAQVSVEVQPEAGHNLNLQRNAPEFFARVGNWTERTFGAAP